MKSPPILASPWLLTLTFVCATRSENELLRLLAPMKREIVFG